jgi:hypothetical protein
MESLSSLQSFTDFRLYCGDSWFHVNSLNFVLPLHILSGLRKITISGGCDDFRRNVVLPLAQAISRSPELSYLEVYNTMNDDDFPSLNDIFANEASETGLPLRYLSLNTFKACLDKVPLSHFKSLRSFTFHKYNHRSFGQTTDSRHLWKAFLSECIHLEELNVDEVNGELMDFIASFSGLQHLTLLRLSSESREASDNTAEVFFQHVLPVHRSTLRSLTLEAVYQGKWCFSEDNASTILDCQKLGDLSIALRWENYHGENSQRSPVVG